MLDHESQWLLRSAFIPGSFGPLTALVMMVTEITEFHPYRISDVSHFYALSFCLVFIALQFPLYSLPTEYQISSFYCTFKKGFPTFYRVTAAEGKKTSKNLEAASLQNHRTTAPDNQETPRLRHREYSALELDLPARWCPNLLLTPTQDRVTSRASTPSSNTLPPSRSSCWSQYQDKFQNYLGIPHQIISTF